MHAVCVAADLPARPGPIRPALTGRLIRVPALIPPAEYRDARIITVRPVRPEFPVAVHPEVHAVFRAGADVAAVRHHAVIVVNIFFANNNI